MEMSLGYVDFMLYAKSTERPLNDDHYIALSCLVGGAPIAQSLGVESLKVPLTT